MAIICSELVSPDDDELANSLFCFFRLRRCRFSSAFAFFSISRFIFSKVFLFFEMTVLLRVGFVTGMHLFRSLAMLSSSMIPTLVSGEFLAAVNYR